MLSGVSELKSCGVGTHRHQRPARVHARRTRLRLPMQLRGRQCRRSCCATRTVADGMDSWKTLRVGRQDRSVV